MQISCYWGGSHYSNVIHSVMVWKHVYTEELKRAHKEAKVAWHLAIGKVFVGNELLYLVARCTFSLNVSISVGWDWDWAAWCDEAEEEESAKRIWREEARCRGLKGTLSCCCTVFHHLCFHFIRFICHPLHREGPMQGTWKHEFHVRGNYGRTSSRQYKINVKDWIRLLFGCQGVLKRDLLNGQMSCCT